MPDLGLNLTTDDQILELLNEVMVEILSRDPFVRRVAQGAVMSINKKCAGYTEAVKAEISRLQDDYLKWVRSQVREDIFAEVKSGELNIPGMLPPGTEAATIAEEHQRVLAEIKAQMEKMPDDASGFSVRYDGNSLTYSYTTRDGRVWDGKRGSVPGNFAARVRTAVITAAGLPG